MKTLLALAVLLVVLTACSGTPVPPVGDTSSTPPLQAPAGLSLPALKNDYRIPPRTPSTGADALAEGEDPFPPPLRGTPPDEAPLPDEKLPAAKPPKKDEPTGWDKGL